MTRSGNACLGNDVSAALQKSSRSLDDQMASTKIRLWESGIRNLVLKVCIGYLPRYWKLHGHGAKQCLGRNDHFIQASQNSSRTLCNMAERIHPAHTEIVARQDSAWCGRSWAVHPRMQAHNKACACLLSCCRGCSTVVCGLANWAHSPWA